MVNTKITINGIPIPHEDDSGEISLSYCDGDLKIGENHEKIPWYRIYCPDFNLYFWYSSSKFVAGFYSKDPRYQGFILLNPDEIRITNPGVLKGGTKTIGSVNVEVIYGS